MRCDTRGDNIFRRCDIDAARNLVRRFGEENVLDAVTVATMLSALRSEWTNAQHTVKSPSWQFVYTARFDLPFPSVISRFALWQLLQSLVTQSVTTNDADAESESLSHLLHHADERLMLHSSITSVKSSPISHRIDADHVNLVPGTVEPHLRHCKRHITSDWNMFVDMFDSAFCELLRSNTLSLTAMPWR